MKTILTLFMIATSTPSLIASEIKESGSVVKMVVAGPAIPSDESSPSAITEELQKTLENEKQKKGSFIRSIISGLKQCSNQKLLAINYLTIKSSYWWDRQPDFKRVKVLDTDDLGIQQYKDFIIDRKFRSSVYDRDGPGYNIKLADPLSKISSTSHEEFVNSWESAAEKIKFYKNEDIGKEPKGTIAGILDYGYKTDAKLDTYPSVYQLMKALKTLKHLQSPVTNAHEKCPAVLQKVEQISPNKIIIHTLDQLFQEPFYLKFSQQNHPLSKIVQDHLKKLYYIADRDSKLTADYQFFKKKKNEYPYNRGILFQNILHNIEKMIRFMSVFNIDMDKKVCEVEGLTVNNTLNDPYYLYVQFYEIINDLLYLLMQTEGSYSRQDFDAIFSQTYTSRIPVLQELRNNGVHIESFPMRSGMDAFVNSSMAIDHMPTDLSIGTRVKGLENTLYYEIDLLLKGFRESHGEGKNESYIAVTQNLQSDDINKIKDDFINAYLNQMVVDSRKQDLQHVRTLKYRWSGNEAENDQMIASWIEQFEKKPFSALTIEGTYYVSGRTDDQQDLVRQFFNKIKQNKIYNNLFEQIQHEGQYYLKAPQYLYDNKHVFSEVKNKMVKNKINLLDYMVAIDDHPSIILGMTTDTKDIDGGDLTNLLKRFKTVYEIKRKRSQSDQPFVVLWDTTLEISQSPCYFIIETFKKEIEEGKMVFILFKSLQKYANLGVGKMKAGVTTLIGKESAIQPIRTKLEKYAADVWKHHADEMQLMTFYYDRFTIFYYDEYTYKPSFKPIKDLQDNEAFYYNAVSQHVRRIGAENRLSEISGGCLYSISPRTVPFSDTFGFAIPTKLNFNGTKLRYSVGLNPRGLQ